MPDQKGAPVEDYKVSDDMKGWMSRLKQIQQIGKMVKAKQAQVQQGQHILQQMLRSHVSQMPKVQTNENPGMEFRA